MNYLSFNFLLSPLTGLARFYAINPRLAPWANLSRHSVAEN